MNEQLLLKKIEQMEQEIATLQRDRENSLSRRLGRWQQKIRRKITLPLTAVMFIMMSSVAIATYFSPPVFNTGGTISAAAFTNYFQDISDRLWGRSGVDLYYDGGDVGIGTSTPSTKLEIWSAARPNAYIASDSSTWADVIIRNPENDADAATGLMFGIESNPAYAGPGIAGVAEGTAAGPNPQGLAFLTINGGEAGPTERMRISKDGNVGIGTKTPGFMEGVNTTRQDFRGLDIQKSVDNAEANVLSLANSHYGYPGTSGSVSITMTPHGNYSRKGVKLRAVKEDSYGSLETADSGFEIYTAENDEWNLGFYQDRSGKVGIGTSNPVANLDISGDVKVKRIYTQAGDFPSTTDQWQATGYYMDNYSIVMVLTGVCCISNPGVWVVYKLYGSYVRVTNLTGAQARLDLMLDSSHQILIKNDGNGAGNYSIVRMN